jgi:membrane protein implicated in regulation of membrane protease activity
MAGKAQPRGARGTVGHAYSALNLRLVLALFGLVTSVVFGVLAAMAGYPVPAVILFVLAAVAVVDLVVIQRRRVARHREEAPGRRHSLFE